MGQIAVRQRQQPDVIEQQVTSVIDAFAKLGNLRFGVVGQQLFAVDAFFHQIGNQRVELTVRLLRISFIAAVDGGFLIEGSQKRAGGGKLPVRFFFGYEFKGAHRKGAADFFSADLFTAQLGLHSAKQRFFA
ncbi:hypothetical protein D3C75_892400 [compost metagenome]